MKRLLLLIATIIVLPPTQIFSQEYFPFPDTNAAWNTVGDNEITGGEWHFRYAVSGDTVINSMVYSKIYKMYDSTILHPNSTYFAAIRENDNKQVFCLISGFPESILYDFNLDIGDTIWYNIGGGLCYNDVDFWVESHYKMVMGIDSFLLDNNTYRKSWTLEGALWEHTWLEGIGSINWYGLFNPLISAIALCGDSYQFACFKQNDIVLYLDNPFCEKCFCQLYTGIEKHKNYDRPLINIFPNPSKSKIIIQFNEPVPTKYLMVIYNATGNKMDERIIHNSQIFDLSVSHYASGLYTLQIFNFERQRIGSEKFIIE